MMIDKIVQKFLDNPSYFRNGAGYLAKAFGCSKEEVYAAKKRARELQKIGSMFQSGEPDIFKGEFKKRKVEYTGFLKDKPTEQDLKESAEWDEYNKCCSIVEKAEAMNIIAEHEDTVVGALDKLAKFVGGSQGDEGMTKNFIAQRNLTPQEIEELAGVDGINTYVARVWEKLTPQGHWTYSIDVRWRVKDFYTGEKLKEKLKELMPDITPVCLPSSEEPSDETALVVLLADDHAGAVNKTNLFDNPDVSYEDRLMKIADEIMMYDNTFDEIHIVSLGDQMNGWNKQTTRGGHMVDSLSNEEQFDIYVSARVKFYNRIFSSGKSENYFIHDVENSNHSGLGMSYMANRALEMYLDNKFPQVVRESVKDMIGGFQYGKHVILMGHGKDEKFQRRPMPANLDAKTDLYLYDYSQNKGYSPYNDYITFYKGDLHQLGYQHGKFGRYVNVPSVAGNSDYGDTNFGNTKGGAMLEIYDKNSYRVASLPIWF